MLNLTSNQITIVISGNIIKGIETFKQNNLSKLVEEEMKKLNPQLDPKDLKLQELQNKFETLEKEKVRETLMNKGFKKVPMFHRPMIKR